MAEACSSLCRDEAWVTQGIEPLVSSLRVIVPPVSMALPEELINSLKLISSTFFYL